MAAGVVFEFPGNIVFDMIWCLELNCPWDIEEIGMDHLTGNLVSELAWCVCARFENVGEFNLPFKLPNIATQVDGVEARNIYITYRMITDQND